MFISAFNDGLNKVDDIFSSKVFIYLFFFCQDFFHRYWRIKGQQEKGVDHLYSPLPLPSVHEHSDIYLQLCMWDVNHVFLITPLVINKLLLNENYHLGELILDWLMMTMEYWFLFYFWFDSRVFYNSLTRGSGELELAWTITLLLQANRLTAKIA